MNWTYSSVATASGSMQVHFGEPVRSVWSFGEQETIVVQWQRSNPVYPEADIAASIAWYQRMFGFEPRVLNPPGDEVPVYAVLGRDAVSIHLLRKDAAPYGLAVPVEAQFWIEGGLVADPDGNIVWVTVPLRPGAT